MDFQAVSCKRAAVCLAWFLDDFGIVPITGAWTVVLIALVVLVYILLMTLTGAVKKEEILWLKGLLKNNISLLILWILPYNKKERKSGQDTIPIHRLFMIKRISKEKDGRTCGKF